MNKEHYNELIDLSQKPVFGYSSLNRVGCPYSNSALSISMIWIILFLLQRLSVIQPWLHSMHPSRISAYYPEIKSWIKSFS